MDAESRTSAKAVIAVHFLDVRAFGCPNCGYRSSSRLMSQAGSEIRICGECRNTFVVLGIGMIRSSIMVGGQYPEISDHPRRGIARHGRPDETPETGGEYFASRGLGLDGTPGCFVCGGEWNLYNNISGFVRTRESGSRVVELFEHGVRLDHRDFEPDWIQVKIGACDAHKPNLQWLHELTRDADGIITATMVQEASAFS